MINFFRYLLLNQGRYKSLETVLILPGISLIEAVMPRFLHAVPQFLTLSNKDS